jgi:hypothetical protein
MTTKEKVEKTETNEAAHKRYFNLSAAAIALAALAPATAIDRELEANQVVASPGSSAADRAAYLLRGVTTQGEFAAQVINFTHGEGLPIAADDLTRALAVAFPNADVEKRHGPHYLCHARKGNVKVVKGLREGMAPIPFATRARAPSTASAVDFAPGPIAVPPESGPAVEPETATSILAANDRKSLQDLARKRGVKASGRNEEIAARIAASAKKRKPRSGSSGEEAAA